MQKTFTFLLLIFLILILGLFQSCKEDGPITSDTNQQPNTIGPEGGVIELSDGAKLEIPAGALSSNQTITFTKTENQVANTDCNLYELGPDGLTFQDSITLSLPYEMEKISTFVQDSYSLISIYKYENDYLTKLITNIDTVNHKAITKITHFSTYFITYPGYYVTYYNEHKNDQGNIMQIPFYAQWASQWCAFYSTSMVLRYHDYFNKGHKLASWLGKKFTEGIRGSELDNFDKKLNQEGISTELAYPRWVYPYALMGYLMYKIDQGEPVITLSPNTEHAFVVSGHNPVGFYVNDPSGVFLEAATGSQPSAESLEMVLVPYDKFYYGITKNWDIFGGWESSLVIKHQVGKQYSGGPTINIPLTRSFFRFYNNSQTAFTGSLELGGNFQPNGYAFTINGQTINEFDEDNFIAIKPEIASSNQTQSIDVKLYYKIDGNNVGSSPISLTIPAGNCSFQPAEKRFQIGNVAAGLHKFQIELKSSDSQILFDSLSFMFKTKDTFLPWAISTVASGNTLYWLSVPTSNTVYIAGPNVFLKSTNFGETWNSISDVSWGTDIHFFNENVGFRLQGRGIYKTVNGGASWSVHSFNINSLDLRDIFFLNDNLGFIVGHTGYPNPIQGYIFKTTDGGASWQSQLCGNQTMSSIFFVNQSVGYATGFNKCLKTTDSGNNWFTIASPSVQLYTFIYFITPEVGFLGGNKALWKTINGGNSWNLIINFPSFCRSLHFPSELIGYVVGEEGIIYKTKDGGNSWFPISYQTHHYNNVFFTNENEGILIGHDAYNYSNYDGIFGKTSSGGQ